jgi:cysteine desulfurase
MSELLYLDNAATTEPCPEALAETALVQQRHWANPSSPHLAGLAAGRYLEDCRRRLAAVLGCEASELVFCSGGTESDVLALRGVARKGGRILVSAIEHPAVLETALRLRDEGLTVETIPVDGLGLVQEDALVKLLETETRLVSIQHANSEIGTLQSVGRLAALVKHLQPKCLVHCDAVQTLGKLPLPLGQGSVDLLSISSHKIRGPKGAGALFVKKGLALRPWLTGGKQEGGLRGGTHNLPAIAGFVVAAELAQKDLDQNNRTLTRLAQRLQERVEAELPEALLTGSPTARVPGHLSFRIPGILSQNLLHFLEERGVLASSGSACHSTGNRLSGVLEALGMPGGLQAFVRLCPTWTNTEAEMDRAAVALAEAARELLKKT